MYMNSTSDSSGRVSITVTFEAGTDPDMAQVQVQNKIQTAISTLPQVVQQLGVTIQKTSASFLMIVGFISTDGRMNAADLSDFLVSNIQEPLSRVYGVGEAEVFGASYAMRVWLDPDKLVKYSLDTADVVSAIESQNVQISSGALAAQPTDGRQEYTATIASSSLLQTPEEFGDPAQSDARRFERTCATSRRSRSASRPSWRRAPTTDAALRHSDQPASGAKRPADGGKRSYPPRRT